MMLLGVVESIIKKQLIGLFSPDCIVWFDFFSHKLPNCGYPTTHHHQTTFKHKFTSGVNTIISHRISIYSKSLPCQTLAACKFKHGLDLI